MTTKRISPDWIPPEQRPTVTVKPHSYQPSKDELEADMTLRHADGSRWTPEEAARALLQPVNVVEDPEA